MNLRSQAALLLLSDEGSRVVELAGLSLLANGNFVDANIAESDDLGLWLRVPRNSRIRLFLLRWEYVVAMELLDEQSVAAGLHRIK